MYPRDHPELSELVDSTIGEGSPSKRSFGYYVHGIDETTAPLPHGWRDRLILVSGENTRFIRGWCLEVHDLAIAKYVAGREKDLDFTAVLVQHRMITHAVLWEQFASTTVVPEVRLILERRIQRQFPKQAG